jgi:hypothetical protein
MVEGGVNGARLVVGLVGVLICVLQACMASAEHSIDFLWEVFRFCEACAAKGFITEGVEADYAHFGSWTVRIRARSRTKPRSLIATWDGREGELAIKERVRDVTGNWPLKAAAETKLDTSKGDDPFTYCLQFLDR